MARPDPRILEIGPVSLMREAYPHTTELWSTQPELWEPLRDGDRLITLTALPALARRLRDPSLDLIVVHPNSYAPWSAQAVVRSVFRRSALRGEIRYFRFFGQEMLRGGVTAPVAVWDTDDSPLVYAHNLALLDRAKFYFKRELPLDHWRVFMDQTRQRVPTPRFRRIAKNRQRVAKLRPISLGLPLGRQALAPAPLPAAERTADVFFAGRVEDSSTVRQRGFAELMALREQGLRVDFPANDLTLEDYLTRCSRAWLVWSPEGYGHECFRTYEAALCGSVPVISRQTIERHHPLGEGEHCFYHDAEPGALTHTLHHALSDRAKLIEMGRAARDFVLANHTLQKLARYVAETTLASDQFNEGRVRSERSGNDAIA